jgi:hypothetical protein
MRRGIAGGLPAASCHQAAGYFRYDKFCFESWRSVAITVLAAEKWRPTHLLENEKSHA